MQLQCAAGMQEMRFDPQCSQEETSTVLRRLHLFQNTLGAEHTQNPWTPPDLRNPIWKYKLRAFVEHAWSPSFFRDLQEGHGPSRWRGLIGPSRVLVVTRLKEVFQHLILLQRRHEALRKIIALRAAAKAHGSRTARMLLKRNECSML